MISNKKRHLPPIELLEKAAGLYSIADGKKTRSMIDAVRDVYVEEHSGASFNGDSVWRMALESLSEATNPKLINGFQTWETQEGRTIEECREAFALAIPIAKKEMLAQREAELNQRCYC
jgi:hypothetical protein